MFEKLHFFVQLYLILYCSILILQQVRADDEENINLLNSYETTYQEDLFTLDDDDGQFIKLNTTNKLRIGNVLDCFGIGTKFAGVLDWFLKTDANGTDALKVKFYAVSRNKQERMTIYHGEQFTKDELDFNIERRTILIVHGFLSSGEEKWIYDMTNALLKWVSICALLVE